MFTASSQRIESSVTGEARSRGFQSKSRQKYKQRNMRWTDLVHFRDTETERWRDYMRASAAHYDALKTPTSHYVFSSPTKAANLSDPLPKDFENGVHVLIYARVSKRHDTPSPILRSSLSNSKSRNYISEKKKNQAHVGNVISCEVT